MTWHAGTVRSRDLNFAFYGLTASRQRDMFTSISCMETNIKVGVKIEIAAGEKTAMPVSGNSEDGLQTSSMSKDCEWQVRHLGNETCLQS